MNVKHNKAGNPQELLAADASPILRLVFASFHMANIYRAGWLESGRDVPKDICESVAEHVTIMRYIARYLRQMYSHKFPNIDWIKVYDLIDIHDMCEINYCDITPKDNISKAEKAKCEDDAMVELYRALPQSEDLDLFKEYQEHVTEESKLAHQIDYFQMALRAFIYSKQLKTDLSEFFKARHTKLLGNPILGQLLEELI